jgi:glutamine amidotransferase
MHIAIVKYNAGNIQSVRFALERLGLEGDWTDDPETLRRADRVIFPGVGEASSAMHYLRARGLDAVLPTLEQPVLGICLGLQLFCRHSEEGDTPCLGIFDELVRRFDPAKGSVAVLDTTHTTEKRANSPAAATTANLEVGATLKIPQIGWNRLTDLRGPLFDGVPDGSFVYFVHSYRADLGPDTAARTDYGEVFSAALQRDNFYAVQFHPEKSGAVGQRILENFLYKC